jgi:hypothetical protein
MEKKAKINLELLRRCAVVGQLGSRLLKGADGLDSDEE